MSFKHPISKLKAWLGLLIRRVASKLKTGLILLLRYIVSKLKLWLNKLFSYLTRKIKAFLNILLRYAWYFLSIIKRESEETEPFPIKKIIAKRLRLKKSPRKDQPPRQTK